MKHSNGYKVIYIIYCLILFSAFELASQDMTAKFDSIVNEAVEVPIGPDGVLYGKARSEEDALVPQVDHVFMIKEDNVRVVFEASDSHLIDTVTVYMDGEQKSTRVKK